MSAHPLMRGMFLSFYANQADREAVVLSAVGNRALAEYVMPRGSCFLRLLEIDEHGYIDADSGRPVSYKAIPKRFLDDMRANRDEVAKLLKGGFDGAEVRGRMGKHERERREMMAAANRNHILNLEVK